MDFLLSLSVKAKEKLSKATLPPNANKSVMYADQTLSEEDVSWRYSELALFTFASHFTFEKHSLIMTLGEMGV
jgi:hypothetical protein